MVKIILRETRHANSLHHAHRPLIDSRSERDDLGQPELAEPEIERGGRGLAGIAPSPVFTRQPPANLNTRREMGLERRNRQTDEPNERGKFRHLNRPEAVAISVEVVANPCCPGVAFLTA